jgi:predicted MFS family arabinose efflux permease
VSPGKELISGWRNLAAATLGLACGVPAYSPVSSLFFRVLTHEFGWSATAAAASVLSLPLTAICLPIAGSLLDRFGVRRVAAISCVLMVLSYFWLSSMNGNLGPFYAATISLNVLGCATGPIAYTRPIASQFVRARGVALAICLLGISISGMVLPVALAHVMAAAGWRAGYWLLGSVSLLGGMIAIVLMKPEPHIETTKRTRSILPAGLLRAPSFWLLSIAIFCTSVAAIGLVSQFQSVMIERGLPPSQAIALLSSLAASVFVTRLFVGWSLDVFPAERTAAVALGLAAIGAVLLLLKQGSILYAASATLLIGFSIGAELDLLSFFCVRYFGVRDFGAVYGAIGVFFYTGMAAGALLYAAIRDQTGSYILAIAASAGLLLIAAGLFLTLRPPPSSADRAENN